MSDQLEPVRAEINLAASIAADSSLRNRHTQADVALEVAAAKDFLANALASINTAFARLKDFEVAPIDFSGISDALAAIVFPPASLFAVVELPTDGTPCNAILQDAIFNATGPIYVPAGRYVVDATNPIKLKSGLHLYLHPDAVFVVQANSAIRYYVFLGEGVSDVLIQGGQIIGDRLKHTYATQPNPLHNTHEWGMGVGIRNGKRVTLRNIKVRECTGDGFSISGQEIYLIDCVSIRNRRQGLSIYSGRTIRVIRGEYAYTGNMSVGGVTNAGARPMAGIDMEPDNGDLVDVVIDGANIHDNGTTDVLAWSRDEDPNRTDEINVLGVLVIDCTIIGAPNGVQGKGLGGKVEIEVLGCTTSRHKGAAFFAEAGALIKAGNTTMAGRNFIDTVDSFPMPKDLPGIVTRYDMQVRTGGVIQAGLNNYR